MRNFYKYAMKRINLLGSLVLILFLYNSSMADARIGTFGEGSFGFEYNTETREAIVIGLFMHQNQISQQIEFLKYHQQLSWIR